MSVTAVSPDLSKLKESYRRSFLEHGDSAAAVQWPKGRQKLRWSALTRHIPKGASGSFLDFGCGLGHFKAFIDESFPGSVYTGVDVVPEFIKHAQSRDPDATWLLIDNVEDLASEYDWIILSGVFNKLYFDNVAQHREYLDRVITALFLRARVSISIDFMSDRVEWQQPGAYHESVPDIRSRVQASLSPRICIDESYMPYEFALTIFRQAEIARPENIY